MSEVDRERLKALAANLVWWKAPEEALAEPRRLLAQAMAFGTWEEMQWLKELFGMAALKETLIHAPPGVFDCRSWAYWRAVCGLPEAELPVRSLK